MSSLKVNKEELLEFTNMCRTKTSRLINGYMHVYTFEYNRQEYWNPLKYDSR